ncbi:phage upper tail fiber protein [Psychrobacter sp. ASPA161_6]|uniref:phage upper tail fiber protein n=1 Tax=Psychrobacter sp. ASPA161_6 TaxID=3160962 RepID=UPI003F7DF613
MSQQFGSPASVIGNEGQDGKSAYEIAVINGFAGTQNEWLLSLKGADGVDGNTIIDQRTQKSIKVWTGAQVQYDAVTPKDANTLYVIKL